MLGTRSRRAPAAQALLEGAARLLSRRTLDGIELDDLAILGPIFVLKLRFTPKKLGRRLVAEMWLYPDGSRVLELSTRARTAEAFQVAAEVRAFLAERGVDVSGEQETKTRKALEYFAEEPEAGGRRRHDRPALGVADVRRRLRRRPSAGFAANDARAGARRATRSYLLSLESDASVKVRDGLMDVKLLEAVDDDGLEQWKPVMKASFPLAAAGVRAVFDALAVAAPPLVRDEYTVEQLVGELVDPDPACWSVEVHKHRERFTVGGCDGGAVRDPGRTRAPGGRSRSSRRTRPSWSRRYASSGSPRAPNVCMARGLKALVGFGA